MNCFRLEIHHKISSLILAHVEVNSFSINVAFGVQLGLELVIVLRGPRQINLSILSRVIEARKKLLKHVIFIKLLIFNEIH